MKKIFLLILLMVVTKFAAAQNYNRFTFNELKELANGGNVKAMIELAHRYGYRKMSTEAYKWYRKAAMQEDVSGIIYLACCYRDAKGVPINIQEANRLFKKTINKCNALINQGNTEGYVQLAQMYRYGDGVPRDEQKALQLYLEAANRGDAEGAYEVGRIYYMGRGVKKDKSEAAKWFLSAAEKGNAEAMGDLGKIYDFGWGVSKNEKEAEKWYLRSAAQGNVDCYFTLGLFYNSKNKDEAIYWFKKYADNWYERFGNEDCPSVFEKLRKLGVYYHPADKNSYSTANDNSSSSSSSSTTSSSSSGNQPNASGTYTISQQGQSITTGNYTGVAGPDMTVTIEFYDDYITVNGLMCEYAGVSGGRKRYNDPTQFAGSSTAYYVDANYNVQKQMTLSTAFGTDWFNYTVVKGEVNIPKATPYQAPSSSHSSGLGNSDKKHTTKTYQKDCPQCLGSGKCRTCNGRHRYLNPLTYEYVTCPNCGTDGRCRACGGTGKK